MEKRKMKNQGGNTEIKKKKHKKCKDSSLKADNVDCNLKSDIWNNDDRQKSKLKKDIDLNIKASNMQNLLTEKLIKVQNKRSEKNEFAHIKIEETRMKVDQVPNNIEIDTVDSKSNLNGNIKRNKKEKTEIKVDEQTVAEESSESVEKEENELDPEKAAIREKKREKRKQKKLDKQKLKQQNADRAGTGQKAAIEYLNQWKNNKDEWKFLKVRQVWLLQNMYDPKLIEDDSFEILLEYLEGLKGKSREVTVSEAEKALEKSESADEESSSVLIDRARQIIQLLSD